MPGSGEWLIIGLLLTVNVVALIALRSHRKAHREHL
jgi:hypothetical protein